MNNNQIKKLASWALMLAMIFSLFVGLSPSAVASGTSEYSAIEGTGYDSADDVVYVTTTIEKYGEVIHNWGVQGETCVFLSVYAEAFYTGEYVFDDMSQSYGGTSKDNAHDSDLYAELAALMTGNHKVITTYDDTRFQYMFTDCEKGDSSMIRLYYSGDLYASAWESGNTWNREHVWPKSKGLVSGETTLDGADIMTLRPAYRGTNSARNNKARSSSNSSAYICE